MMMLLAAWLLGIQVGTGQNTGVPSAPAVVLQVTMPSGRVSRLTVPPGKRGSVGSVLGPSLDLSPTLRDDGSLELVVTELVWDPTTDSLASKNVERQVVQAGETAAFPNGDFPIAVKWLGTVAVTVPAWSVTPDADSDRCCVVCGSEVICGCAVVTPCGDCSLASCGCQDGSIKRIE